MPEFGHLSEERQQERLEAYEKCEEPFYPTLEQTAQIEAIVNKPWRVELFPDFDDPKRYIAIMPELEISGFSNSREEALKSVENALHLLVAAYFQLNIEEFLPEPGEQSEHGERLNV